MSSYTNRGFTGQYADATGLDYYNARYYDPIAGVFLSADPVQGNPQGMNPYGYVDGNPETMSDPTGNMYVPPPSGGGNGSPPSPPPQPPPPPPSNGGGWLGNAWNSISSFGNTTINVVKNVADATLGISSMVGDVQTIFNGNASWQDKLWAGADLLVNASMDVMMVAGIGEEARGVYEAGKIGLSLLMHGAEDMSLHEGEDLITHAGEEEATHLAESGACSFIAATRVMTSMGELAIGTLHPGQKVLAYNPKTHKMELQPILHVWIHTDNDLVDLTITTPTHAPHSTTVTKTSETIHTNQKHPFFTEEKGFVPVGQLKIGMHVLRADGRIGVISGWKIVPGVKTMYNLTVAHDHTFVVGTGEWVVHNTCQVGDVGSYQDMKKTSPAGDGLTPHHMPQGSLAQHFGFDYKEGGTIVMDAATHSQTYNYAGRASTVMRNIISSGMTFRDALAGSIRDYRSLVPDSNDSIRQLIQYWRDTYPGLMQK